MQKQILIKSKLFEPGTKSLNKAIASCGKKYAEFIGKQIKLEIEFY